MNYLKPIMLISFRKVKDFIRFFKVTLVSKRCILIRLNFWRLPSCHKFASKQLGTLSLQLHFYFLSGVHNNLCLYVQEMCYSLVNCDLVSQNVP